MENENKAGQTNEVNENVSGTDTGAGQVTPPAVTEKSDDVVNGTDAGTGNEVTEKPTSKQSSATNSEFARRRREQEKESLKRETRLNTIKELVGKNPWTDEPIETEQDAQMYLRMKKIEDNGGDPLADYAKTLAAEERAKQKNKEVGAHGVKFEELSEEQKNERISSDISRFQEKHPDVDVDELLKNEDFLAIAEEHLGEVPLSTLYSLYTKVDAGKKQKATAIEKQAAQKAANDASVGALGTPNAGAETEFYTKEQVENMSQAEISKNYDKIRRSQERW